jgi:hypothetical protein
VAVRGISDPEDRSAFRIRTRERSWRRNGVPAGIDHGGTEEPTPFGHPLLFEWRPPSDAVDRRGSGSGSGSGSGDE